MRLLDIEKIAKSLKIYQEPSEPNLYYVYFRGNKRKSKCYFVAFVSVRVIKFSKLKTSAMKISNYSSAENVIRGINIRVSQGGYSIELT